MVVKVDVQKTRGGVYWTNRYLIDIADPLDFSLAMKSAILSLEVPLHGTTVNFVSMRISDMVIGTDNYVIIPLSGAGGTNGGTDLLPGFVTLRMDFGVGVGAPLRKYYRTYVGEAQMAGANWASDYLADANSLAAAFVSSGLALCDPQGNVFANAVVKNAVQMRQLRRGKRKQETPVIPVS